jgi:hypothetical protein
MRRAVLVIFLLFGLSDVILAQNNCCALWCSTRTEENRCRVSFQRYVCPDCQPWNPTVGYVDLYCTNSSGNCVFECECACAPGGPTAGGYGNSSQWSIGYFDCEDHLIFDSYSCLGCPTATPTPTPTPEPERRESACVGIEVFFAKGRKDLDALAGLVLRTREALLICFHPGRGIARHAVFPGRKPQRYETPVCVYRPPELSHLPK